MERKDGVARINCLSMFGNQGGFTEKKALEERMKDCASDIQEVLNKYGMTLQVENDIQIVPIE